MEVFGGNVLLSKINDNKLNADQTDCRRRAGTGRCREHI